MLVENNVSLKKILASYKTFILWDFLKELDTDRIFKHIEDHLSGKSVNLSLTNHLLSIEALLKDKTGVKV